MLKDLLMKSRSYRSFDQSVSISTEQLRDMIDHTRYAPSSINLQMLKYRIVNTPEECARVLENTRWAGKIKDEVIPPIGHAPVAYIVICHDTDVIDFHEMFLKDVGICAQTIMLAACEAGFGGCMIGGFSKETLSAQLGLSKNLIPQLVLALGKPDEAVELIAPAEDGSVTYYRENGIHYVQKRELEDIIVI